MQTRVWADRGVRASVSCLAKRGTRSFTRIGQANCPANYFFHYLQNADKERERASAASLPRRLHRLDTRISLPRRLACRAIYAASNASSRDIPNQRKHDNLKIQNPPCAESALGQTALGIRQLCNRKTTTSPPPTRRLLLGLLLLLKWHRNQSELTPGQSIHLLRHTFRIQWSGFRRRRRSPTGNPARQSRRILIPCLIPCNSNNNSRCTIPCRLHMQCHLLK